MNLSIQSIGAPLRQNSAPQKGLGGPPSHENVFSQFGKNLTEEQRTSILKTISELNRAAFPGWRSIEGVVLLSRREWHHFS